mmetsp:Transcript_342/g.1622  ORF Transcript_342/g.1622 Transcript_342/m.1622 type:complete len:228 (+) Transcript_342:441-1124(+)
MYASTRSEYIRSGSNASPLTVTIRCPPSTSMPSSHWKESASCSGQLARDEDNASDMAAPTTLMTTFELGKGHSALRSAYVIVPSVYTRLARTPPEFMNAASAPTTSRIAVASSVAIELIPLRTPTDERGGSETILVSVATSSSLAGSSHRFAAALASGHGTYVGVHSMTGSPFFCLGGARRFLATVICGGVPRGASSGQYRSTITTVLASSPAFKTTHPSTDSSNSP